MKIKRHGNFDNIGTITNWYDLGCALGVKTNLMSYVLHERDEMQTKIRLGERVVYNSGPYLKFIQSRIVSLAESLFDKLPDNESAIAYRRKTSAVEKVKEIRHAKTFISFDIRHYFDNITLAKLEECLTKCGMAPLGARLVGRYCVVKNKGRSTLQQGSPASPVLSNIVGYFSFDEPIKKWLAEQDVDVSYLRYCDNIAIFVHGEMPENFVQNLKNFVKPALKAEGFTTHKWNSISDNHPVMHQKFLGMVINKEARPEKDLFDNLRAILFNCCRNGFNTNTNIFLDKNGIKTNIYFASENVSIDKFKSFLRGHINYISKINSRYGLILEKLYTAAEYLQNRVTPFPLYVRRYRANETLEEYLEKVKQEVESYHLT